MSEKSNIFNENHILLKIKSKYIIIKIFDNLKQNKLLDIIHYNKKYQKVMNIKLKDYKNEFSKIEIEIIPKENTYGSFINFLNKNIHIYFNDNKKEIKTKKITKDDKVTRVKIIIEHKIKSLFKLFYYCKCIKKINFIKFNKDDIKNMSYMFCECSSLEEINFSNFNTNNVTNMSCMFRNCTSLKELNLSNFNTNNVTSMYSMFDGCSSLEELNLSNFNTNNVTNINWIFFGCPSLVSLSCTNDLIKKEYEKLSNN